MNDFSSLQFAVGAFGCMVLAISTAFVAYWYLFAKKHLVVQQQKARKSNTPIVRLSSSAAPAFNTRGQ